MGSGVSKGYQDQLILQAAAEGNVEKCVSMVKQGYDVNALNIANKWTPLHFAAKAGNVELTEALISLGADKSLTTIKGRTAAQLAEDNGMDRVLGLFFVDISNMSIEPKSDSPKQGTKWTSEISIQGAIAASEEDERYKDSIMDSQIADIS
mmetsp:Transcript_25816/g.30539  ORF Transcript_25816/g.30539 Transcript_25816/m.30539 type:complete len:151 (+) Transcript_25816:119-571(+)